MSFNPLNTIDDLVALLRDPDARTAAMLEAALGAGELAAWLQARWRPTADAPRLAGRVRDLCQRLQGRGALARFALLNLLEPGQPLPLGAGRILHAPDELNALLQAHPDQRQALLDALQQRIEDGCLAEWLRAGEFPGAGQVLSLLDDCQRRYPNEPRLRAYAVYWFYAPTAGLPFANAEVADVRELAAQIASRRQSGLKALRHGWLRTWLVATERLANLFALDRLLDDGNLHPEQQLEVVLHLLDSELPWPRPVCDPAALDFGWIHPEAIAERSLTVRAAGSGFLWGEATLEPPVAGVTLDPTGFQGPNSTLRLRVEPRGLRRSSHHAGDVVLRSTGGEVRVPWRFAVGVNPLPARSLALAALIGVAMLIIVGVGLKDIVWKKIPPPPQPYYDWHACPGEGCFYPLGYIAKQSIIAYTKPDYSSTQAFTISNQQKLIADDGVVITTIPGKYIVTKPTTINNIPAHLGDVVYSYTYQGEGDALVWFQGHMSNEFVVSSDLVKSEREWQGIWWVKARDRNGHVGWVAQPDYDSNLLELVAGGSYCSPIKEDFFTEKKVICN